MKGYRFYATMPEARRSKSASKAHPHDPWTVASMRKRAERGEKVDVIALDTDQHYNFNPSCVATAIEGNHSSYCTTSCDVTWLATRNVRISEELARKLAPALFRYLEP